MTWFAETPWPPILICVTLAVMLMVRLFLVPRGMYVVGVALLLLAGASVYIVERALVTPREEVEAAVYGVASAFESQELDKTLDYFSARNDDERAIVAKAMAFVTRIDHLRITDLKIEMRSQNTRAASHFRANADVATRIHGELGRQSSRWLLTWQREGGKWKIVETVHLHPFRDETRPILPL